MPFSRVYASIPDASPGPSALFPAPTRIDPDLLALPNPPKHERVGASVVLVVTAIAATAMAVALAADAGYAFAPPDAIALGDLRAADLDAPRSEGTVVNRFVSGHAMLGAAGAVRYERPLQADSFRVAPVAGRKDVWIEVRVPEGLESARYVPPTQFAGRLVLLDRAGPRHRGLRASLTGASGQPLPERAWLLEDGAIPARARWAVALVALFFGFAAWNVGALLRLYRRAR